MIKQTKYTYINSELMGDIKDDIDKCQ